MTRQMLTITALLVGAVLSGGSSRTPVPEQGTARQDYNSGDYLYRVFCLSCHGEAGRGDGPVADLLRARPPDLTALAAHNGGVFPRERVSAIVDGRTPVPGHSRQEMPVWGDRLQVTEGRDEAVIRKRIEALVSHLESIQVKGGV